MVKGKKLLAMSLAVTMAASTALSGVARADQMSDDIFDESRPKGGSMIMDALIARPLLAGATVVGAAFFVVSMPFSLVGGTVGHTWERMVLTPGEQAFIRCLGCTPVQHERIRSERKTAQLADDAATARVEEAPASN